MTQLSAPDSNHPKPPPATSDLVIPGLFQREIDITSTPYYSIPAILDFLSKNNANQQQYQHPPSKDASSFGLVRQSKTSTSNDAGTYPTASYQEQNPQSQSQSQQAVSDDNFNYMDYLNFPDDADTPAPSKDSDSDSSDDDDEPRLHPKMAPLTRAEISFDFYSRRFRLHNSNMSRIQHEQLALRSLGEPLNYNIKTALVTEKELGIASRRLRHARIVLKKERVRELGPMAAELEEFMGRQSCLRVCMRAGKGVRSPVVKVGRMGVVKPGGGREGKRVG